MGYLETWFNLSGKTAALSGAGGLLVGEMARHMARAGINVALLDINDEVTGQVGDEISAGGGNALVLRTDVTKKGDWQDSLGRIVDHFGSVDILVNGAGANAPTPFFDIPEDEWDRILRVQLTGTMLGCQIFGKYFVEQKSGSIINISSASSGPPLSKAFTYSVAKAGVKNLTQNLAREWATDGVRVNAIRPGFFPSEFMKENFLTAERIEAILTHTPMKRFGEASELVGAVLWLASEAAAFVTGAEIPVDGGFTAMTI
jgi:NAD(P)-dependent dehydrogenase (short-subunit alcohol dehydrogenase family)